MSVTAPFVRAGIKADVSLSLGGSNLWAKGPIHRSHARQNQARARESAFHSYAPGIFSVLVTLPDIL